MLGSGFIGEFHTDGLRYVPDVRVAANYGAGPERREAFAARHGSRPYDSIDGVCADPDVDLVVVSLPNHLHLQAVRSAAEHGKAAPARSRLDELQPRRRRCSGSSRTPASSTPTSRTSSS